MTTHEDIVRRWRDVQLGKEKRLLMPTGSKVLAAPDAVYSYGRHFPLVEALREEDGTLHGFLLNGDTYSVTTSRHQSVTRGVIEGGVYPSVVVPYSALARLGVSGRGARDVRIVARNEPSWVPRLVTQSRPPLWISEASRFEGEPPAEPPEGGDRSMSSTAWYHGADDMWRAWTYRHVLEESVLRVGERYFLSGIDHQDFTYFLVQLPRPATSVADAYDSLVPESVTLAREAGLEVLRQGDLFFIRTDLSTRDLTRMGATRERGGTLYRTNHRATEVATGERAVFARGIARHRPINRRPDHRSLHLGDRKGWWLCVRNAAPIAPTPERVSAWA